MNNILLLVFGLLILSGNDSIQYRNTALQRALKKLNGNTLYTQIVLPDEIEESADIAGKFFETPGSGNEVEAKYIFTGRVNSCRAGGCSAPGSTSGSFEFFDYSIFFDKNGTVLRVYVFNYQATHGQEITARSWLKQFQGYKGEKKLMPGKQIDTISGATVSVFALTEDIVEKTGMLAEYIAGISAITH